MSLARGLCEEQKEDLRISSILGCVYLVKAAINYFTLWIN